MKSLNFHFNLGTIATADQITESVCSEFTLSSKGIVSQLYPGIIGDYQLQHERNNGRAVYRSKEIVIRNTTTGYIYLYSFNAEENADYENYGKLSVLTGLWMVRLIKYLIISRFLVVHFIND